MRGEGRQLLPIRRQRQGRLRPLNLLFQVADDALTIVTAELGELHTEPKNGGSFPFHPRLAVAHDPAGMNVSPRQGEDEAVLATEFEREVHREQPSKEAEVQHAKLDLLFQLSRLTDEHARLLTALVGQAVADVGADSGTLRHRKLL